MGASDNLAERQRWHQREAKADDHQVMLLALGHERLSPVLTRYKLERVEQSLRRHGEDAVN